MTGFSGFVAAGLQLGYGAVLVKPKRGLFSITTADGSAIPDIVAQATFEERHSDELEITEHPVQQGAMISDHAFKRPSEVVLHMGWSNSPTSSGNLIDPLIAAAASLKSSVLNAADAAGLKTAIPGIQSSASGANVTQIRAIYDSLVQLQSSRALFTLYTGKRTYKNMICKSLSLTTDFKSENSLPITMTCKEIILVNAQTVSLSKDSQKEPAVTSSQVDRGTQAVTVKKIDVLQSRVLGR